MKRKIENKNSIKMMGKNTMRKNTQRAVNPCGCTHTHTHTHTFSLIDCKNIKNLQIGSIGSQYYCEPYLVIIK